MCILHNQPLLHTEFKIANESQNTLNCSQIAMVLQQKYESVAQQNLLKFEGIIHAEIRSNLNNYTLRSSFSMPILD